MIGTCQMHAQIGAVSESLNELDIRIEQLWIVFQYQKYGQGEEIVAR